jgi:hypothetical protein
MRRFWKLGATGVAMLAASGCSTWSGISNYSQNALAGVREARDSCRGTGENALVNTLTGGDHTEQEVAQEAATVVTYSAAMTRARNCQTFYRGLSAGAIGVDAGASALSGAGALGLLASGGRAVRSTTDAFGVLAVAPLVLRDVVNQSSQAALARQAGAAVELAQCHADQLHFSINDLRTAQASLQTQLEAARLMQADLDAFIDARFNALRQAPPEEGAAGEGASALEALADVVQRDRQLQDLIRFAGVLQDAVFAAEQLSATMLLEADASSGLEARIAQRLDLRLDIINRTWADAFIGLAPTPDRTMRSILAAPLSATANLISGQSQGPEQQAAVEGALFDFSNARMTFGAQGEDVSAPTTRFDLTLFDVADWSELRRYQSGLAALAESADRASARLNGLAALDRRIARGFCSLEDPVSP